jgi:hypothetical protein
MARALFALLLVLPLALAGCSDSSNDSKPASTPYGGSGAPTPPPAPAGPPITDADVDKWVAVTLDFFKTKPKGPEGQKAILDRHGYTLDTWFALDSRIRRANGSITGFEKHKIEIPAERAVDVEAIRPHREKIMKAMEGKAL